MTTKFTIIETTRPAKLEKQRIKLDYGGGRWVRGTIEGLVFDVKVYPCGSKYGIHDGSISKLSIRDTTTRRELASYDRGWDILPESQDIIDMVDALVEHYWA